MERKTMLATAMAALLTMGLTAAVPANAANPGQGRGAKMFDRHDANGDGKITQEEFMARCANRFTMMDLDGNGEVTQQEAREAFDKMRANRKGMGRDGSGSGKGPKQRQPQ